MMARLLPDRQARGELLRFVLVGVKSNIIYVLIYVGLTALGLDHRIALTVVYVFGIFYTFLFNRFYVFKATHDSKARQFRRYLLLYGGIWLTNMLFFQMLAGGFGINPYVAQAVYVVIVASVIFVLNKYFIFGGKRERRMGDQSERAG